LNTLKPEIVHLNHNDSDAIGCSLNLHYSMPDRKKVMFNTNYTDLLEKINDVILYIQKNNVDLLVISDISFADNLSDLLHIQSEVQDKLGVKILYFDHHTYKPDFFKDITFFYIHDITKSATLIMNEAFHSKNENLNKLSKLINDFDIWVEDSNTFNISIALNEYLWNGIKNKSIDAVIKEIIDNDYKLGKNFIDFFKKHTIDSKNTLKNLKEKGLFINDNFLSIIFTDEYFNDALYESFHNDKCKVAIIVNSYGIFRIRFSTINCLSDSEKEKIKLAIMGTLEYGHLNAFSLKVQNSNFKKIMSKVQELTTIINTNKPNKYK